jgi:predicted nucleic acid-binding protein
MTALDTNVIVDIEEGSSDVVEAATRAVERAGEGGRIVICGVVYAELLARPGAEPSELRVALRAARILLDPTLPVEVWSQAGVAYGAYVRRRKAAHVSQPRRILADFIIGSHARTVGALVTSDAEFYRRAFPDLRVIDVRGDG